MRIALAGNPNSGKTTLFNVLTGSNQHVGNFPGVTVEKKEGLLKDDKNSELVDLPGIYSLSPYTLEEIVARDYLLNEHPDAIINIVDGSNLERNLYLTSQLIELGIPVVVAINMMDVLEKRGDKLDSAALSSILGCKVVEISALKGTGLDELVACLPEIAAGGAAQPMAFGPLESVLQETVALVTDNGNDALRRFYALKLLEGDEKIRDEVAGLPDVSAQIAEVERIADDKSDAAIINQRYVWVEEVTSQVIVPSEASLGDSISDKIDRVVTNRILALPIFVVVMFLVYYLSVTAIGSVATDWANDGVFGDGWFLDPSPIVQVDGAQAAFDEVSGEYEDACAVLDGGVGGYFDAYDDETGANERITIDQAMYDDAVSVVGQYGENAESYGDSGPNPSDFGIWIPGIPALLDGLLLDTAAIDPDGWLYGLIMDGIVAGVGSMLGFLPQMFILFLLLAMLELCGYTARVAFILDRIFRRFGLSGKSFIPLLISSGCGVPGIMASRTIENVNDRRMTIMTTTFIPCGAKLPFIALIAGAVFGGEWWVAPSAYFLGIAGILLSGVILKKTRFFSGEATPFVMELPEYRIPSPASVIQSAGERCLAFAKKAVTVLLLAAIIIWFLSNYGFEQGVFGAVSNQDASLLAVVGGVIAPIFDPLGFGTWQAASASIAGIMAKEQIVSTLAILCQSPDGWYAAVQAAFPALNAYAFLAFNLLCIPCFAAMSAIWREMGSLKWALAAWGYEVAVAWVVGLWIYQLVGFATGLVAFGFWTVVAALTLAVVIYLLVRPRRVRGTSDAPASANER